MENEQISFRQLRDEDYIALNQELNAKDTLDVLKWAYSTFGDEIVYACSFGAEGMVLIDLISKIRKDAKVVFLDTNVHFKETYELIKRVQQRYPSLRIELLQPGLSLEEQASRYGDELWKSKPDQCCALRKLAPLEKALSGARAWISGLRRDQSPTRKNTQYVNCDRKFSSIKICPLIHWTWNDIWKYITLLDLEYNELHDKGYPSIGCEHCTLPAANTDDMRSGRWAGFGKTECGLHQ